MKKIYQEILAYQGDLNHFIKSPPKIGIKADAKY